jgi:hypothetical protein
MLKRILYVGMILILCTGFLFSQTATAPAGSGTSEDPFHIVWKNWRIVS